MRQSVKRRADPPSKALWRLIAVWLNRLSLNCLNPWEVRALRVRPKNLVLDNYRLHYAVQFFKGFINWKTEYSCKVLGHMVDQEYIAASMELEFMDQKWRDVLLATVDLKLPPSEALIDIWIYGFSPRDFGVNAWRHFDLPENGCSLVQKIVAGDYSFAKNQRPELR